jgi:hypothetical protein
MLKGLIMATYLFYLGWANSGRVLCVLVDVEFVPRTIWNKVKGEFIL